MKPSFSSDFIEKFEQLDSPIVVIAGPTASGKTSLSLRLAKALGGEIVNGDSVQAYRFFDIGSAKPTLSEFAKAPHHLFDIYGINDHADAQTFASKAQEAMEGILARGNLPILVGGSGLYVRAIMGENFDDLPADRVLREKLSNWSDLDLLKKLKSLDPVRAKQIHSNDSFRLKRAVELCLLLGRPISEVFAENDVPNRKPLKALDEKYPLLAKSQFFKILIVPERATLHQRIESRVQEMLKFGLLAEAEALLNRGYKEDHAAMKSIGYRECVLYLQGKLGEDLHEKICAKTRQYAKRQITWFKKLNPDIQVEHPDQV